jgi:hypothetical protein
MAEGRRQHQRLHDHEGREAHLCRVMMSGIEPPGFHSGGAAAAVTTSVSKCR